MAQGTLLTFDSLIVQLGSKIHNLTSDVFKLGIIDNTVTPVSTEADPKWTTYSANEVSTAGGYTAGGISLSGTTSFLTAVGITTFDSSLDIEITKNVAGFTDAYWGILYNDTATNKNAIGFIDLGGPVSEQANTINITWGTEGIFKVTKI